MNNTDSDTDNSNTSNDTIKNHGESQDQSGSVTSAFNFDLTVNYAYGEPSERLDFRRSPEEFIVDELLDVNFSGEGEHFWLKIAKRGENTQWIADKLATYFSISSRDVGYAGMKDRHAVTTQWFSLYLPGKRHSMDWSAFVEASSVNAQLLASHTHSQKLRRGQHLGNRFCLVLHGLKDAESMQARLLKIKELGVPNYFGEQRFGRDGNNLQMAINSFETARPIRNKHKKGLALSAARSYLFNTVLSQRVSQGNWHTLMDGDATNIDQNTISDIVPTGPMWGRGRPLCSGDTAKLESEALADYGMWCDQLEHCGLSQDRRPLVLKPIDMSWEIEGDRLSVSFDLLGGAFATSVLREVAILTNCSDRVMATDPNSKIDGTKGI